MENACPTYRYAWKNNEVRASFYGLRCFVLARGTMNSCLLQFEDGRKLITSRNSIRKVVIVGHDHV